MTDVIATEYEASAELEAAPPAPEVVEVDVDHVLNVVELMTAVGAGDSSPS